MTISLSFLEIPFISRCSAVEQAGIFASLLFISYFSKKARYITSVFILGSIGFNSLIPLTEILYTMVKGVAWLGFYIKFSKIGYEYMQMGWEHIKEFWEEALKQSSKGPEPERSQYYSQQHQQYHEHQQHHQYAYFHWELCDHCRQEQEAQERVRGAGAKASEAQNAQNAKSSKKSRKGRR